MSVDTEYTQVTRNSWYLQLEPNLNDIFFKLNIF